MNNQVSLSQPTRRSTTVDGLELQYLEYAGGEETIVFLHATGFLPWLWHPLARCFAGRFRVLAPYFCDHRTADPHQGGISWVVLAEDLRRFGERLKLVQPLMVGHSMGGTVLTLMEALYGPLARRMVLIEPIYLPEPIYSLPRTVAGHPLASKSIRRRNHWQDLAEARDYLQTKDLFKNWDPEMIEIYLDRGLVRGEEAGLTLACHPEREASLFLGSQAQNPWPLLPRVGCPVLLLEGGDSPNREYIDLQKASALMPHATRRILPGTGHLLPMEKPAEVAAIIEEFFTPEG